MPENLKHDLKFFHIVHRAFNSINILNDKEGNRFTRSAGTLYQLQTHSGAEEADAKICHYTILLAGRSRLYQCQ